MARGSRPPELDTSSTLFSFFSAFTAGAPLVGSSGGATPRYSRLTGTGAGASLWKTCARGRRAVSDADLWWPSRSEGPSAAACAPSLARAVGAPRRRWRARPAAPRPRPRRWPLAPSSRLLAGRQAHNSGHAEASPCGDWPGALALGPRSTPGPAPATPSRALPAASSLLLTLERRDGAHSRARRAGGGSGGAQLEGHGADVGQAVGLSGQDRARVHLRGQLALARGRAPLRPATRRSAATDPSRLCGLSRAPQLHAARWLSTAASSGFAPAARLLRTPLR
jgi:hypothetical protein